MKSLNDIIKGVDDIKETLSTKVCDKLKGDCNKCPFRENCIVSQLVCIAFDISQIKDKLKEII